MYDYFIKVANDFRDGYVNTVNIDTRINRSIGSYPISTITITLEMRDYDRLARRNEWDV